MSNSGRRRFAWPAALIPAASPPMTTSLSLTMVFLLEDWMQTFATGILKQIVKIVLSPFPFPPGEN
jgi:hypothetical protein